MIFISTVLTTWLGTLFIYSSGLKLARYEQSRNSVNSYNILPQRIALIAGIFLPWVELAAGVLLLFGIFAPAGPILAIILGAAFSFATFRTLQRKANVPCGCAGNSSDRVTSTTFWRALTIATSSVFILWSLQGRSNTLPIPIVVIFIAGSLVPAALISFNRNWAHVVQSNS